MIEIQPHEFEPLPGGGECMYVEFDGPGLTANMLRCLGYEHDPIHHNEGDTTPMPKTTPDYAGITQAAKDIAARENTPFDTPADTLSGSTLIVWADSTTKAVTEHEPQNPTVPATVTHTARFNVEPMALPPVQMAYGKVKFWPENVTLTWIDGDLASVYVAGHQATKAGLGKDMRQQTFKRPYVWQAEQQPAFDRSKIPALLRAVISRYELKVPVQSPSPVVVA